MRLILCTMLLALVAHFSPAQSDAPQRLRTHEGATPARPVAAGLSNPPIIDRLRFPSGTLSEYADAIREAVEPAYANIVIDPAARDWPVTGVELRGVTIESALRLVADRQERSVTLDDGRRHDESLNLSIIADGIGEPIYRVVHRESMSGSKSPFGAPPRSVQAYSLREFNQQTDELLSLIEAAVSADTSGNTEPADLRYHSESGMLIVAGAPAQHDLIQQVLQRLANDSSRANADADQLRSRLRDLELEAVSLETNAQMDRVNIQEAERRLALLSQQRDGGVVSADELANAETQYERTRVSYEGTSRRADMIAQELEAVRAELSRVTAASGQPAIAFIELPPLREKRDRQELALATAREFVAEAHLYFTRDAAPVIIARGSASDLDGLRAALLRLARGIDKDFEMPPLERQLNRF